MQVEIYTETTVRRPREKHGKYAAVAVYQTTKGPAEKYIVGEESDTTFHRMSLLALLEGLKMLKKPCKVTAYTPDQFLASTVNEGALEKWKREALTESLQQWLELLEGALMSRSGGTAVSSLSRQLSQHRTAAELYGGVTVLKKALDYTRGNVSPAAVCGWLSWELR